MHHPKVLFLYAQLYYQIIQIGVYNILWSQSLKILVSFTDDKPVLKEVQKKKNLKESLVKWREEKQKRLDESLKQKLRKPEFVVSRNCQSKPVTALTAVKNSTYRNVAPRVVCIKIAQIQEFLFSSVWCWCLLDEKLLHNNQLCF